MKGISWPQACGSGGSQWGPTAASSSNRLGFLFIHPDLLVASNSHWCT